MFYDYFPLLVPSFPPSHIFFLLFPSSFFGFASFGRLRGAAYIRNTLRETRDGAAEYLGFNDAPLGTQPMRPGYSLDETHTPEVVACLIPALLRSPVITFTAPLPAHGVAVVIVAVTRRARLRKTGPIIRRSPLIASSARNRGCYTRNTISIHC